MSVDRKSPSYKSVANYPFVNFTWEFAKDQYGVDILELSIRANKAWNRLTDAQRKRYHRKGIRNDDDAGPSRPPPRPDLQSNASGEHQPNSSASDACCPKKRRSRPKARCPPPKPRCPRPRKPKCAPKPRCPRKPKAKPKPKRKSCPKPRCKPKRKPACKPKCQNPGPVTNNGYLNFLRDYRRTHCGLKPKDLVMKAARAWCRLPECNKDEYRRQVKIPTDSHICRVCTTRP